MIEDAAARQDERHAVIDIGSNTVRLVIYGGHPRAPTAIWNEKVSARLGRDLAHGGAIPAAAMDEALAALARYARILAEMGVARIETVATAAPREATNGAEFVRRVEQLGLSVRVLSGEDEARASAWGAIGAFPGANGVVADLGGGSLELVAIAGAECAEATSFPLGTLRLPALRSTGRFDRKVAKLLKDADWARDRASLYLVGGTWRALAAYAMRSVDHPLTDPHGLVLTGAEAAGIARKLARADPAQLAQHRGISTMRAEKLPDAAALLSVLLAELRPGELVFSSWGLREGLYFRSLDPRERALDPLLAGVEEFAANRHASQADAALIAAWTAPALRAIGDVPANLHLAATQLSIALHRVEPNLRSSQALRWALDKRWLGIDFSGRAMLGAALRGSLGITEPHQRLVRLASEETLHAAIAWGLAYRLAQRLGAGSAAPLRGSCLIVDDASAELRIDARNAALVTAPVEKDLRAFANWIGRSPKRATAA